MNRNIKLTIEYDGTEFNGWQIQAQGPRTVQGEISNVLAKICKKPVTLIGSGRTDTGVHAIGQTAHFKSNLKLPAEQLIIALNTHLPADVTILGAEDVKSDFHAQQSAKSKIYRYTILNRTVPSALLRNFCLVYQRNLNVAAMRAESKALIGRKDFKSFQASDPRKRSKNQSTVRTVKNLSIKKEGDYILIDIEANGFLYKMVRNIVGTLLAIGSGQLPKGSVAKILKGKDRKGAGDTARAQGLCLREVKY